MADKYYTVTVVIDDGDSVIAHAEFIHAREDRLYRLIPVMYGVLGCNALSHEGGQELMVEDSFFPDVERIIKEKNESA